jgi:regulator of replication initiation timing
MYIKEERGQIINLLIQGQTSEIKKALKTFNDALDEIEKLRLDNEQLRKQLTRSRNRLNNKQIKDIL